MAQNSNTADRKSSSSESGGSFWVMLALLVVAAMVLIALQARRPKPSSPYVGLPLPPLQAEGWLNTDKPLTTADLQGKVVLVDYWATWCGPCVKGIPTLVKFDQRFRDAGILVVGLTSEGGAATEQVKNLAETRGMSWPIAYGAGMTFQMMGINGIPMYVLYDRSGTSVWGGHSLDGVEEAAVAALSKK